MRMRENVHLLKLMTGFIVYLYVWESIEKNQKIHVPKSEGGVRMVCKF